MLVSSVFNHVLGVTRDRGSRIAVAVLDHSHKLVWVEFAVFQSEPISSCSYVGHYWEESGSSCFPLTCSGRKHTWIRSPSVLSYGWTESLSAFPCMRDAPSPGQLRDPSLNSLQYVHTLYWWAWNWIHYPRCLTSTEQSGTVTSLGMLAVLCQVQLSTATHFISWSTLTTTFHTHCSSVCLQNIIQFGIFIVG